MKNRQTATKTMHNAVPRKLQEKDNGKYTLSVLQQVRVEIEREAEAALPKTRMTRDIPVEQKRGNTATR